MHGVVIHEPFLELFERRWADLPTFCGPFLTSEMAFSGLVSDSCRLNSAGVRFPRLEWGRTSLN